MISKIFRTGLKHTIGIALPLLLGIIVQCPKANADAFPLTITCAAPEPVGPSDMKRVGGDTDTWQFELSPATGVTLVNVVWSESAPPTGAAVDWGTWANPNVNELDWVPPVGGIKGSGDFWVEADFDISGCGTGTAGPPGGAKHYKVRWGGTVQDTGVEVASVTFKGNNSVKQDDGTFADDGIAARVPEIQKTAGTGIGSDPPKTLSYDPPSPVCYTWTTTPSLSVTFNVSPLLAGKTAQVKLAGEVPGQALNFGTEVLPLDVASTTSDFESDAAIPQQIANGNFTLTFTISYDGGTTWLPLINTSNALYVTAGTPIYSSPTAKRLLQATTDASGSTSAADAAAKIGSLRQNTPFNGGLSVMGAHPTLATPWQILDAGFGASDCVSASELSYYEVAMLGITGSEVRMVYPRHTSWDNLYTNNTTDSEIDAGVDPGTHLKLFIWFRGGGGVNYYEGCYYYGHKYYLGNTQTTANSAIEVLADVAGYPAVINSTDANHQAYETDYDPPSTKLPTFDTYTGVTFPDDPKIPTN